MLEAIQRINDIQQNSGNLHQENRPLDKMQEAFNLFATNPDFYVCQLAASNGKSIKLTFSVSQKRISGEVQSENSPPVPIRSQDLPKEFQSIKTPHSFLSFFKNICRRADIFSDGTVRFLLNGSLLGGDPLKEALTNLKANLEVIANPFLYEEIIEKILGFSNQSEFVGIADLFSISMPQETQECIRKLDIAILSKLREAGETASQIKLDLGLLAEPKRKNEYPSWEPLEIFFKFRAVKLLKNEMVAHIIALINKGVTEELQNFVIKALENDLIEINNVLKDTDYEDLQTLLAEIIEQKPQPKEGILALWGEDSHFFEGKTVYLNDPETQESYCGIIKNCMSAQSWNVKDSRNLRCKDETVINVQLNFEGEYTVSIEQKHPYRLWTAIQDMILEINEFFEIKTSPDIDLQEYIKPGKYKIVSRTEKTHFGNHIEVGLANERHELKYTLQISPEKESKQREIKIVAQSSKKSDQYLKLSFVDFNRSYIALKSIKKTLTSIDKTNIDQFIRVKDETDINALKLEILEEINQLISNLRRELLQSENKKLLDALRDDLVKHQIEKVDLAILAKRADLLEKLEIICQKYQEIGQLYFPEAILKMIVLEANYTSLIDKDKSVAVSKTMEHLKESYQYHESLKDKDGIFYVGNTGAGKSTAVAHMQGAELEVSVNRVGDRILKLRETGDVAYPVIGQTLGMSQTTYAQGYPINGRSDITLIDCPGFNDTRKDLEMCTNLSMDLAIEAVAKIKALVLTIPIQSLITDKANGVVDLIEAVQERFPLTFNPDQAKANSRVFLLITKHEQTAPEVVKKIKDGTRFSELAGETQSRISRLLEHREVDFELEGTRRTNKIWKVLRQMCHNKQVDFMSVTNKVARKNLIAKYAGGDFLDKSQYVPSMQSADMQRKFRNCIEMSTHTWTTLIFQPYREKIPHKIALSHEKIQEIEEDCRNLNFKLKNNQNHIDLLKQRRNELGQIASKLEEAQRNSKVSNHDLLPMLLKQIQGVKKEQLDQIEKVIEEKKAQAQEFRNRLDKIKSEIKSILIAIEAKLETKTNLINRIDDLAKGEHPTILWEKKYDQDQYCSTLTAKEGALEGAFEQVRPLEDVEITSQIGEKVSERRGKYISYAYIEKEFRVVPKNAKEKSELFKSGKGGKYRAVFEGERATIIGKKAHPDGKRIVYTIETEWKGDVIPHFKITHTVPNIDYHESTIANLSAEVRICEGEIEENRILLNGGTEVKGKKQRKKELKAEIKKLNSDIASKTATKEQLQETLALSEIETILENQRKEISNTADEIEKVELEVAELNEKIKARGIEIEAEKEQLQKHHLEKRNFAIIIYTQMETAKRLRDFCDLVLGNLKEKESKNSREEIVNSCLEFIKIYDNDFQKIKKECLQELNIHDEETGEKEADK